MWPHILPTANIALLCRPVTAFTQINMKCSLIIPIESMKGLCIYDISRWNFHYSCTAEGTKENKGTADVVVNKSVWEIHHLSLWGSAVHLPSCSSLSLTRISVWVSQTPPSLRPGDSSCGRERTWRGKMCTFACSLFMVKTKVQKKMACQRSKALL